MTRLIHALSAWLLASCAVAAEPQALLQTIANGARQHFDQTVAKQGPLAGQPPRFDSQTKVLTVHYPKGSIDPLRSILGQAPWGGVFVRRPLPRAYECVRLRYELRLSPGFEFAHGGKLPGLGGGEGNTGGKVPDGFDGFSVRLMWRDGGLGEVYAYLPGIEKWGRSIGRGTWRLVPGQWMTLEITLRLNRLGQSDGEVQVRVDGKPVLREAGLLFRKRPDLQVDQLIFDSFFGGNDPYWAARKDESIEFKNVSVQEDGC